MDLRAKPGSAVYHRNLPHFQPSGHHLFITFSTCQRWQLPPEARMPVLCHCLHDHLRKVFVCAAVVMPDHVHLILFPLRDSDGTTFSLAEILGGIKGASAHAVNRLLRRRGQVWQDESFDHVVRRGEALDELHDYVRLNPVRRGLVARAEDYPWYWHSSMPLPAPSANPGH